LPEELNIGFLEVGRDVNKLIKRVVDDGLRGANWTQTVPGKGWFAVLRLYGPLEPWFEKTWRPGEFEAVE
jgi:hypothetical protein